MTKKGESRRGAGDNINDADKRRSYINRFRCFIEAILEAAARRIVSRVRGTYDATGGRIDRALTETFRKFDIGLQPPSALAHEQQDTWTELTYWIGSKVDYDRFVRATKRAGIQQRPYYFNACPDARTRSLVFGPKYQRMVRLKKRNIDKI
jgi:hypothetical protein